MREALFVTRYPKPSDISIDQFGPGLKGVNAAAFTSVEQDGDSMWVDWDDGVASFPTSAEIIAGYNNRKWESVRKKRNELLAETDFYALSDVTMSAEMETYRQALRDITTDAKTYDFTTGKQSGGTKDSTDVVWPTKPS